jgi:hypothetical protein
MTALWTQQECADALKVSVSYLRDSTCPKIYLPSTTPNGRAMLRYVPEQVWAWIEANSSNRDWAA